MNRIDLNGIWSFQEQGGEWMEARVPGSVYADLLNNGKMEDPFWSDNELAAMERMNHDFAYRREFDVSEDFINSSDAIRLCFEGIDTVADILLNGVLLAHTENMHRTWEFDVKDALKAGTNTLETVLYSPLKYIREEYQKNRADGSEECTVGFPTLRKTHCQFGWDWGPRLPDAGIWRSVYLTGYEKARLKTAQIEQIHEEGKVTLVVKPEIESFIEGCDIEYKVSVSSPEGSTGYESKSGVIEIKDPMLWWPNGLGDQPLYEVEVSLICCGGELDCWKRKIGLRTMELHIEKDQWGESFAHRVNGIDFFAMGADYIPEDSIFGRRSPERTRRLLEDCALAHYNVIRVWGGGCYPDEWFYDECDRLGLVVWQDFMFACAVYNLTPEFENNIMAELKDNITRIRHHACIGLLCGNNEMEMFVGRRHWVSKSRQVSDYIKMYEYLFPKLVNEIAPQCVYWPASPSSGGDFDEPNSPDRGDTHFWEVWHGGLPFSAYQDHYFRYLSEFGFESLPCRKTIDSFAPKEEQNIFSYTMEKHQRKPGANGKILTYLEQTYLYPHDDDMLIYASQLLQAEAVGYGVEHLRRSRGRCMGAVYWQVNDCWPVASWASIDYFGRWKALHYFARRFFAPVLLSAQVETALTRNPDINQEEISKDKTVKISVSNETRNEWVGRVEWSVCSPDGTAVESGVMNVSVPALSAVWLDELDLSKHGLFDRYLFYRLIDSKGAVIAEKAELFCQPKYFAFNDPELTAEYKDGEILVHAGNFAKAVWIEAENEDILLDENAFDMQPGDRTVRVLRGTPDKLRVYSVYDIR